MDGARLRAQGESQYCEYGSGLRKFHEFLRFVAAGARRAPAVATEGTLAAKFLPRHFFLILIASGRYFSEYFRDGASPLLGIVQLHSAYRIDGRVGDADMTSIARLDGNALIVGGFGSLTFWHSQAGVSHVGLLRYGLPTSNTVVAGNRMAWTLRTSSVPVPGMERADW